VNPTVDQKFYDALREGCGHGVRIGLIDTGVETRHPDLAGKIAGNYEVVMDCEDGRVRRLVQGRDPNEHGTACAHILSRLAPGAEIHSVRVIGDSPGDSPRKLVAGFRFALDQGWDVINISAGAGRPHAALRELADRAWREGRIVVAAKDNHPEETGYPAAYPNVLAVDMEHFGDPLAIRYNGSQPVEVEANGIYIEAARASGGRHNYTGTSFAAPHVAAIAARLKERLPQFDPELFREALKELSERGQLHACSDH